MSSSVGDWRSEAVGEILHGLALLLYSALFDLRSVSILAAAACAALLYYYLLIPLNWTKDLSDVGYDFVPYSRYGRTKKEAVAQIRKLRKVGNLPPVYPNGWFMLAESSEIGVGQVKYVAALGENFALFRDEEGVCHILDAYCPHLGANMGIGGQVKGSCLECPFHGWRFDGRDGKCTSVPYTDKVPKIAKVKKWGSVEVNDFIYVWYHAEGIEPIWFPYEVPEVNTKKYIYRGRNEYLVNCHVQEIPENGSDISHFNYLHGPSVLSGSDLKFRKRVWFHFFRHNWSASWESSSETGKEHLGIGVITHYMTLFRKVKLGDIKVNTTQIGPGIVELRLSSAFGLIIILQAVTPIEPLLQKVVHRIYCPPILSILGTFILMAESIMVERDILAWNHKKYEDNPIKLKEDKTLSKFRRWYRQFYSSSSPTFSSQKQGLDW